MSFFVFWCILHSALQSFIVCYLLISYNDLQTILRVSLVPALSQHWHRQSMSGTRFPKINVYKKLYKLQNERHKHFMSMSIVSSNPYHLCTLSLIIKQDIAVKQLYTNMATGANAEKGIMIKKCMLKFKSFI